MHALEGYNPGRAAPVTSFRHAGVATSEDTAVRARAAWRTFAMRPVAGGAEMREATSDLRRGFSVFRKQRERVALEQLLRVGVHRLLIDVPDDPTHDLAATIDEVGGR